MGRLTEHGIVKYTKPIFDGFHVYDYNVGNPKELYTIEQYLIVKLRKKQSYGKRSDTTLTLAMPLHFEWEKYKEYGYDTDQLCPEALAIVLINTKRGVWPYNSLSKKVDYGWFNEIVKEYLVSMRDWLSPGLFGFNPEDYYCVGGYCRVVDKKEYSKHFIHFLVVKTIRQDIEDALNQTVRDILNGSNK